MPDVVIRKLGPGDENALAIVARDETDFTGEPPSSALSLDAARAYLTDPHLWHWHAEANGEPVGFLMGYVHRQRHGTPRHVMFDEIGVRESWRRKGVGRALIAALHERRRAERISEVWVLADNAPARTFYEACGYEMDELQGQMLTHVIG
jgi:GNAT superfamily N-acetyltransferase